MNSPVDINNVKIEPLCRVAFVHLDDDRVPHLLSGHVINFTGFGRSQLRIITNNNMLFICSHKRVVVLGQDQTQLSYEFAQSERLMARKAKTLNVTTYVVPTPELKPGRLIGRNDDGSFTFLLIDGSTITLHSAHRCYVVNDCDFETEEKLDEVVLEYERSKNTGEGTQPGSTDSEEDNRVSGATWVDSDADARECSAEGLS